MVNRAGHRDYKEYYQKRYGKGYWQTVKDVNVKEKKVMMVNSRGGIWEMEVKELKDRKNRTLEDIKRAIDRGDRVRVYTDGKGRVMSVYIEERIKRVVKMKDSRTAASKFQNDLKELVAMMRNAGMSREMVASIMMGGVASLGIVPVVFTSREEVESIAGRKLSGDEYYRVVSEINRRFSVEKSDIEAVLKDILKDMSEEEYGGKEMEVM